MGTDGGLYETWPLLSSPLPLPLPLWAAPLMRVRARVRVLAPSHVAVRSAPFRTLPADEAKERRLEEALLRMREFKRKGMLDSDRNTASWKEYRRRRRAREAELFRLL